MCVYMFMLLNFIIAQAGFIYEPRDISSPRSDVARLAKREREDIASLSGPFTKIIQWPLLEEGQMSSISDALSGRERAPRSGILTTLSLSLSLSLSLGLPSKLESIPPFSLFLSMGRRRGRHFPAITITSGFMWSLWA